MFSILARIAKKRYCIFWSKLRLKNFERRNKSSCCKPPGDYEKCAVERTSIFGKYLLITNTVSSICLISAGDLIQQELEYILHEKHKDSFDWRRNWHMGLMGFAIGPIAHYFYRILDKSIPGTEPISIIKKIVLDQSIASPTAICIFFFGVNYFSGESFQKSKAELKEKFWTIYAGDCLIWIPTQIINFYWLPPRFRVLYINIVTMCYNVFLSFMKHTNN